MYRHWAGAQGSADAAAAAAAAAGLAATGDTAIMYAAPGAAAGCAQELAVANAGSSGSTTSNNNNGNHGSSASPANTALGGLHFATATNAAAADAATLRVAPNAQVAAQYMYPQMRAMRYLQQNQQHQSQAQAQQRQAQTQAQQVAAQQQQQYVNAVALAHQAVQQRRQQQHGIQNQQVNGRKKQQLRHQQQHLSHHPHRHQQNRQQTSRHESQRGPPHEEENVDMTDVIEIDDDGENIDEGEDDDDDEDEDREGYRGEQGMVGNITIDLDSSSSDGSFMGGHAAVSQKRKSNGEMDMRQKFHKSNNTNKNPSMHDREREPVRAAQASTIAMAMADRASTSVAGNESPAARPDEEQGRAKAMLRSIAQNTDKPIVVVQNWSRETLMGEFAKTEKKLKEKFLYSIFLHSSGYPAGTTPGDPDEIVELSIKQIQKLAAQLVRDQHGMLKNTIDRTFYRCARHVSDIRQVSRFKAASREAAVITEPDPRAKQTGDAPGGDSSNNDNNNNNNNRTAAALPNSPQHMHQKPSAQPQTPGPTLVNNGQQVQLTVKQYNHLIQSRNAQHAYIKDLQRQLKVSTEEKKNMMEAMQKEQAMLKEQVARSKVVHARSVRAYMKASVHSLRFLRDQAFDDDSDDVSDDGKSEKRERIVVPADDEDYNKDGNESDDGGGKIPAEPPKRQNPT